MKLKMILKGQFLAVKKNKKIEGGRGVAESLGVVLETFPSE